VQGSNYFWWALKPHYNVMLIENSVAEIKWHSELLSEFVDRLPILPNSNAVGAV
jgi:hypothetical protein